MKCSELQTLDMLKVGESARILSLNNDIDLRLRLTSLGLIQGTLITAVNESPAGDPKAYFFRGALIALRRNDSRNIIIKRETNGHETDKRETGCGIETENSV